MHQLPRPLDFGLSDNVEEAYMLEEQSYKKDSKKIYREKHKKLYIRILVITFIICFCLSFLADDVNTVADAIGMGLVSTFGTIGWLVILDWIFCVSLKSSDSEFRESDFYKKYKQYKSAVDEYRRKQAAKEESFWLKQDGHQFEKEVAKLYQTYGYKTAISRAGGDGGIDIVLTKGTERIAVQCKHHSKPVSPSVIRDLYGTMLANDFSKGILVSLRGFTQGTKEFAKGKPIELVEMKDLIRMSKQQ